MPPKTRPRLWVHGVSLGEIKTAFPLLDHVEGYEIIATTGTPVALDAAKKNSKIAHSFYLPFDFPPLVKRSIAAIDPDLFILIETDFWPNLIASLDVPIILINGRLSSTAYRRWKQVPFIAKPLFSKITSAYMQTEVDRRRIEELGAPRAEVSCNLKFDRPVPRAVQKEDIVMLTCSHAGEEEMFLDAVGPVLGAWKIVIAPRRPERFDTVAALLKKRGISFARSSENRDAPCILIDQMGVLDTYYAKAKVVLIGASFIPGGAGHSPIEPLLHRAHVFFGEGMHKQRSIVDPLLENGLARTISMDALAEILRGIGEGGIEEKIASFFTLVRGEGQRIWEKVVQETILD